MGLLLLLVLSKGAVAQFRRADFDKLSVLAGTWQMPQEKGMLYEVWELDSDTMLLGRSFSVSGKDTIPEETVQLSWSKGAITYSPTVVDQNKGLPVIFTLKSIGISGFLFENKAHDFPQRIRYQPKGDTLLASVSGKMADGVREIKYSYVRVADTHGRADLGYFAGKWWLKAWTTGDRTGKPDINGTWLVERAPQGSCLTGQVRLLSGRIFTHELIAYNPAQREFTRTIAAADSSYYTFTTKGWAANKLIWLGTQSTRNGSVPMKQEILRKGPDTFRAVFFIRDNGDWNVVMTEELERMPRE